MAVIRDVMPAFELFQPASVDDALELLDRHGANAWVLAGGLDSFDWLKDRIKRPSVVVDLSGVAELRGIRPLGDGLEIGAMTTLTEVVRHPVVRERYGILLKAAEAAASPQIRNQGTIGGNVSQDTRCWYYRAGWPCYRAGGNICYADTPTAINREHAIFGRRPLRRGQPVGHGARAHRARRRRWSFAAATASASSPAEDYFVGPGTDITRMTVLRPGELLTAIRLPGTWAGAQFYFEKVARSKRVGLPARQRRGGDGHVGRHDRRMRLAVNGVAATPLRLPAVENAVRGRPRDEATATMAGDTGDRGRGAAAAQRLQGAAAAQPGQARGPRNGGGHMDLLTWGRSPWGEWILTHISWDLFWASLFAGVRVPRGARELHGALGASQARRGRDRPPRGGRAATSPLESRAIRWPRACFTGSWRRRCSCCCSPRSCRSPASSSRG